MKIIVIPMKISLSSSFLIFTKNESRMWEIEGTKGGHRWIDSIEDSLEEEEEEN